LSIAVQIPVIESQDGASPVISLLLPAVTSDTSQALRYLNINESGLLKVVIALASWPQSKEVSSWLLLLLDQLKQLFARGINIQGSYTMWLKIVEAAIPILSRQLFIPALRGGALEVLERFLLGGHQRSPKPFHGVLQSIFEAFKLMKARCAEYHSAPEPLESGGAAAVDLRAVCECEFLSNNPNKLPKTLSSEPMTTGAMEDLEASLRKVAELLHTQMYQHQGYPELYTPVLQALDGYVRIFHNMVRVIVTAGLIYMRNTNSRVPPTF
jgi:hypothetical protein